jgi:hypothetical protein
MASGSALIEQERRHIVNVNFHRRRPKKMSFLGASENDWHAWLLSQASALRSRESDCIDRDGIAEELEAMAKRDERDLVSALKNLLSHLLKSQWEQKKTHSWELTIDEARDTIEDILGSSSSLKNCLPEFIDIAYRRARREAGKDMNLGRREWDSRFPRACPWAFDEFMDEEFMPVPQNGDS